MNRPVMLLKRSVATGPGAGLTKVLVFLSRMFASLFLLAIAFTAAQVKETHAADGGKTVILAINDVYVINGIDDGDTGGMARVRALRAEIAKTAPDHLFLLAGDFLSPSLLGRLYQGRQMLDLLNVMDGDYRPGTPDPRMFVAFGNHEFDDSSCKDGGPLVDIVAQSEFTWLNSNLDFSKCAELDALAGNAKIVPSRIVESGGLRVGLYGLTLKEGEYADAYSDHFAASCREVRKLRRDGADVVVGLTHLNRADDLKILGVTPGACADVPDLIVGGHDHVSLASQPPKLFKADSDAASAWKIEISRDDQGSLQVKGELVHLSSDKPRDPGVKRLTDMWLLRHGERFCAADCSNIDKFRRCVSDGDPEGCWKTNLKSCLKLVPGGVCLKVVLTRAASLLEAEELTNRGLETGFGDWLADQVRKAGETDVAFINAGNIRLNYNIKAGKDITRRQMETMFPFKNKLVTRQIPGSELWRAVAYAAENRGTGKWAHISGFAVKLRKGKPSIDRILVRKADGKLLEVRENTEDMITIAAASYVLAGRDGHGFDSVCSNPDDRKQCMRDLEADPRWPGADGELSALTSARMRQIGYDLRPANLPDKRFCASTETGCLIENW